MTDLTMCVNYRCPKKLGCYRWCAVPSDRQVYAWFVYKHGVCGHFIPNKPHHKCRDNVDKEPV